MNFYKAKGIAKELKLVNGTNNINHKVLDLLASKIMDINDFIGFIYFYFPSAIFFFYYYLYFASSFQHPFIFIPPYYVPNSFEIDGQSHIYKAFYFLIFLINGFTKLNVTGLQI